MAANAYRAAVTEYGEDPNGQRPGRGLLADVWTRLQGFRTHPYGPADKDPSTTFNGVGPAVQNFQGMGDLLAVGAVPYRNGGSATLASGLVEGPLGDPARRIFATRLRRQSPMSGGA